MEPVHIEPLAGVRAALFFEERPNRPTDPFVRSLLSEIRLYGDQAATLVSAAGGGLRLAWTAPDARPMVLTFASAYPLEISPRGSYDKFTVSQALGFTILRCTPKDAGPCEATVKIPSWASALPAAAPPPRYSEAAR